MNFENAEALRAYLLERFDIRLPKNVWLKQTKTHGIRVFAPSAESGHVLGLEGFMAYSKNTGLSQHFIQMLGHLAQKNVIALNRADALKFAKAEMLKKKVIAQPGLVILAYKGHILGYGILEGKGTIKCPMREKQKRNILTDVAPYPGRSL